MLTIDFKYKISNEIKWCSKSLVVEDYFDLEEYEEPEIWSVPKSSKLLDYIDNDRELVTSIIIVISDWEKNETLTFKQYFWNNQNNSFIESIENKQGNENVELIFESLVDNDSDNMIWEIVRFSRNDDLLTPTFHTFITENENRLVSENVVII